MKATNLALTAIGGMNYLLLQVVDKHADMSSEVRGELEQFVNTLEDELELFVNALEEELEHDRLDDAIRDVIAEELNAGNYFGRDDVPHNISRLRALRRIEDFITRLTGNDASLVPRFYADLLRED